MLGFFKKDPKKKLQEEFNRKLTEAMEAQRNGNIELYAKLSAESEEILREMEKIDGAQVSRDP
jgi:putative heme iron utilization protein